MSGMVQALVRPTAPTLPLEQKRTRLLSPPARSANTWPRRLLWIGAVAPFAAVTPKTAAQAASGAGFLDLVRLAIPLLVIFIVATGPWKLRKQSITWADACLLLFLAFSLASLQWSLNVTATVGPG